MVKGLPKTKEGGPPGLLWVVSRLNPDTEKISARLDSARAREEKRTPGRAGKQQQREADLNNF